MQEGIVAAPHQLAGNGHPLGALWSLCHDTEREAILMYGGCCASTSVIWEPAVFGRQPQFFSLSPGMGSSLPPGAEAALKHLVSLTLEVSELMFYLPFLLNAKIWAKSKF